MTRERHVVWMEKIQEVDEELGELLKAHRRASQCNASHLWSRLGLNSAWRRLMACILILLSPYIFISFNHTRNFNFTFASDGSQVLLPYTYQGSTLKSSSIPLNSTLGFQKVYVLNIHKRVDRRDVMSLMGLASNIDIEFFYGVDSESITSLRLPPVHLVDGLKEIDFQFTAGQLGCYRSNLDIMQKIVNDRVTSALIIQDDVDWDVDLLQSLQRLQAPLHNLISSVDQVKHAKPSQSSPWLHQSWDIFWLGASYEHPWPEPETAPYVLYDDATVAYGNMSEAGGKEVFPQYGIQRASDEEGPFQRLVQKSRQPLGMAAYGVTLSGAAKILARAGSKINQPYDSTICAMSRPNDAEGYRDLGCVIDDPIKGSGESELRSYSVWPPLFSQFRDSSGARDSDLHSDRPKGVKVEGVVGYALEIKNGVREKILSQTWGW